MRKRYEPNRRVAFGLLIPGACESFYNARSLPKLSGNADGRISICTWNLHGPEASTAR